MWSFVSRRRRGAIPQVKSQCLPLSIQHDGRMRGLVFEGCLDLMGGKPRPLRNEQRREACATPPLSGLKPRHFTRGVIPPGDRSWRAHPQGHRRALALDHPAPFRIVPQTRVRMGHEIPGNVVFELVHDHVIHDHDKRELPAAEKNMPIHALDNSVDAVATACITKRIRPIIRVTEIHDVTAWPVVVIVSVLTATIDEDGVVKFAAAVFAILVHTREVVVAGVPCEFFPQGAERE